METVPDKEVMEQRVLRLEERLDLMAFGAGREQGVFHPGWAFSLGAAALVFGFLGLGLPQHYYQFLFAGLLLLLLYHRGFLVSPSGHWRWPQVALNFLLILLLFKLLIGGGMTHPLSWFKLPAIVKGSIPDDASWYDKLVPDFSLQWKALPALSEWAVDYTKIQTLLLIATLAGALFRFEPFTSITALALIIVSIPRYLEFTWDWVVLFLVVGSIAIYMQTRVDTFRRSG